MPRSPGLERREDLGRQLDAATRARLDRGEHEAVATELAADDRFAEAGWVLEQIWDFAGAAGHYLLAGRVLDALRAGLEDGGPDALAQVFEALEARRDPELCREAASLLERRRRHEDAARVLRWGEASPEAQAAALTAAGDRLAAARTLAAAGQTRQALERLGPPALSDSATATLAAEHALAAELCWDLGDAEGTARHAQAARRGPAALDHPGDQPSDQQTKLRRLLARALSSLGHDLAGQLVLAEAPDDPFQGTSEELVAHGRYRVTGVLPAPFAGAAYVGVDRVSLQEVELHLLLAEYGEHEQPGRGVRAALDRFARIAEAAQALAHPAIRPILRLDPHVGLLVMPRREGPLLRNLVRAPGMASAAPVRARSLIAFMLDALATAHAAGLTHGSLLPSQIVCDALGRPLLGPFGAHRLSGLIATRTGGLEELIALTPPEQRAGEPPTQASDLYMLGALWVALLVGRFGDPIVGLAELPDKEREELVRWLDPDPSARPSAREALAHLEQAPVSDLAQLVAGQRVEDSARPRPALDRRLGRAITVQASASWSDEALEALCAARNPWLQNILDRDGRTFQLAAWPEGCRRLEAQAKWREQLDPLALSLLVPSSEPNAREALQSAAPEAAVSEAANSALRAEISARLDGEAIVITPAEERMIALDQLLLR
ncbi:hypothetical protein G6O69_30325 [Pseudenhygromyxa sp. WMMC2535]|uniref:hypothetical protein n=1 Tax=Pseudenhygromyxa sp. WMMC2535 TaxID=2712867 RepID=UPI0015550E22|nr:hypothetical protein [Pseudenhygromyxa sp. WMMC2535]NVB42158.1 hypothetical protein [Pseudenhygromyxa sp. WMMC2535]